MPMGGCNPLILSNSCGVAAILAAAALIHVHNAEPVERRYSSAPSSSPYASLNA
jgi:hypothetical protein